MDTPRWRGKAERPVAVRGARGCRWDYCHTPASNRIASTTGHAVFELPGYNIVLAWSRMRGQTGEPPAGNGETARLAQQDRAYGYEP